MSTCDDHKLHGQHINVSYAGEDLSGQVLSGTYVRTDFQNTNMQGASLIGVFIACRSDGANLNGADTSNGTFVDSDFSTANQKST